jgi:hypothetical protein
MRFFGFKWFGQSNLSRLLINVLKYFWFWFQICEIFDFSSIPHILSIRIDRFCIYSVYEQIHSVYSQYMNRFILRILSKLFLRFISFRVFSVYLQIISAYSQYTNRLNLRILSKRTDSFRILWECAQIILNIQNVIISFIPFKGILLQKKYICVQLDQRPTGNNQLFGPSLT